MPVGPNSARAPRTDEFGEVDQLLLTAFGGSEEARLVHRLRQSGVLLQELVMSWPDRNQGDKPVIGAYAAISRMISPKNWFCLAPVAVKPEWQNGALVSDPALRNSFRLGSRLVGMIAGPFIATWGSDLMARAGILDGEEPPTLVVLGKPSFYTRCGFSQARATRLTSPYPIDHTLIARPGDDVPVRTLIYPTAFDAT